MSIVSRFVLVLFDCLFVCFGNGIEWEWLWQRKEKKERIIIRELFLAWETSMRQIDRWIDGASPKSEKSERLFSIFLNRKKESATKGANKNNNKVQASEKHKIKNNKKQVKQAIGKVETFCSDQQIADCYITSAHSSLSLERRETAFRHCLTSKLVHSRLQLIKLYNRLTRLFRSRAAPLVPCLFRSSH